PNRDVCEAPTQRAVLHDQADENDQRSQKRYNRATTSRCKQRNGEKGQGHISHQAGALRETAKYESDRNEDTGRRKASRPNRVEGGPDRVAGGEHLRCSVARETLSKHHRVT